MESNDQNAELLNALKTGADHRGMELVFKRFYSEMVDYAWNILGTKKGAEDVVMEVFFKLLKRTINFESVNNLRAYLMIAVRNTCFTTLDQEDKRRRDLKQASQEADVWRSLDYEAMDARVVQIIFSEIDNLPNRARTIFLLKTFNKCSYEDIAAQLNITAKTVKNQYFLAITKLRTSSLKKDMVFSIITFFLFNIHVIFSRHF